MDGFSLIQYLFLAIPGLVLILGVNAGLKLHQTPEQKCTIWLDLAGVKVLHLVGLWSNRVAVFAL